MHHYTLDITQDIQEDFYQDGLIIKVECDLEFVHILIVFYF